MEAGFEIFDAQGRSINRTTDTFARIVHEQGVSSGSGRVNLPINPNNAGFAYFGINDSLRQYHRFTIGNGYISWVDIDPPSSGYLIVFLYS